MSMLLNDLITPRKIKVALLVLATFAAMCLSGPARQPGEVP